MKIIFVNPIIRPQDPPFHIPFGIAILARIADQLGHEVGILDLNAYRLSLDAFREELRGEDYKDADLIGIGGLSSQYKFVKPLLPIVRKEIPNALIVLGGGLLTSAPEDVMKLLSDADLGVIGEGEKTFEEMLDVVDNKNFSRVKGLIYREGDELVRTPYRPLIENMDEIPWPHWDMLPLEVYFQFSANLMGPASPPELQRSRRRMSIVTERGCPRMCTFCQHLGQSTQDLRVIHKDPKIKGPNVRWNSARYVIDMVKHLRFKYGVDFVSILDENFLANKKRAYEIADLWEQEDLAGLVHFGVLGDVASADYELLQRLRDVGLTYVSYGGETASDRLLREIKKYTTVKQTQSAIDATIKAGITPIVTYMCMPPDQLVMSNPSLKAISELQQGDLCIGSQGQVQRVENVFSRPYSGDLVCLKVAGFPEVRLTPEHPVLVRERSPIRQRRVEGKRVKIPWWERLGEPIWVRASEVRGGQFVVIPRLKAEENVTLDLSPFVKGSRWSVRVPLKIPLTKEVAELFGWYLAEGCTYQNVNFDLGRSELSHARRIQELLFKLFNAKSTTYPLRGQLRVQSGAYVLGRFLKAHFGPRAREKRVPDFIMNAPVPIVEAFLGGYGLGDGFKGIWSGHRREGYTTSSEVLAYQIALLLVKVGKRPCIYDQERKDGFAGGGRKYLIIVNGTTHERSYLGSDYLYCPVTKLRMESYSGPVYNIKTEDGTFNTFFLVHNCGYPTETTGDYIQTVEFWRRNQMLVRPFLITPYPGTELFYVHKDRILQQHGDNIENFLLSLGDATDLSANISPWDDATLLGLRELATMQDADRIRRWADGKKA